MTYAETKTKFLERCATLLPQPLHATFILDEIGDAFPEIHTAEREYVCALDSHAEIIAKTDALTDDDIRAYLLSYVPDAIVEIAEDDDDDEPLQLTASDADVIMTFARSIDPTESNIAAAVRDAIRDNFDHPDFHI